MPVAGLNLVQTSHSATKLVSCRDAEDAVRGRDGYVFDNNPIRVELSRGGMGGRRQVPASRLDL